MNSMYSIYVLGYIIVISNKVKDSELRAFYHLIILLGVDVKSTRQCKQAVVD